jgi:hypothetical protein
MLRRVQLVSIQGEYTAIKDSQMYCLAIQEAVLSVKEKDTHDK